MPLRVTIEIVPNGDENRAEVLHRLEITQTHRYDRRPDGMRGYRVVDLLDNRVLTASLRHWRSDGAAALVRKALVHIGR